MTEILGYLAPIVLGIFAVFWVWRRPPGPPPAPPLRLDLDLEQARLDDLEQTRLDDLAELRAIAEDPDADRRTKALATMVDR